MRCTETACELNCQGFCHRIEAIKNYFELDIPEPDGCPEMTPKTSQSEEA
ncbi:MAG: hypothetical protein K6G10_01450 [Butyrivibrio sp.]|nr:hypothetical protein [Butyrivibrio sp.]